MSGSPPTSRRFTVQAVKPDDGSTMDVLFASHRLQWARNMGEGAILELSHSVKAVLEQPTALFEGFRRDSDDDKGEEEGWLCYVGKPVQRYELQTCRVRPNFGRVLLVFVNAEGVYYNHAWERECPQNPGLPEDTDERFKVRRF